MPDRYAPGSAEGEAPGIAGADRVLNERLAREGQAAGYAPFLVDGTRFHRARVMPLVGRRAILDSLGSAPTYSGTSLSSETARSQDLGFSYGTYGGGESGAYLRIWQRRADGAWVLAVDLRRPER